VGWAPAMPTAAITVASMEARIRNLCRTICVMVIPPGCDLMFLFERSGRQLDQPIERPLLPRSS
jgi:hypothetical protein